MCSSQYFGEEKFLQEPKNIEFVEIPSSTHEFNIGAEVEVKGTKEFIEK